MAKRGFMQQFLSLFPGGMSPIHLDHILSGRFSRLDGRVLRLYINECGALLNKKQLRLLKVILAEEKCHTPERHAAVMELKSVIDPKQVRMASWSTITTFALPMFVVMVSLIAGLIMVFNRISSTSTERRYDDWRDVKEIQYAFEKMNERYRMMDDQLKDLSEFKDTYIQQMAQLEELVRIAAKKEITDELSQVLIRAQEDPNASSNDVRLGFLSESLKTNSKQLDSLLSEIDALRGLMGNQKEIASRLEKIEAMVNESPETVISLRLLQRDVAGLTKQLMGKAEFTVLEEKERTLSNRVDDIFTGIARELNMLRWVLYLLIIGGTASGGVIVALRRRKA